MWGEAPLGIKIMSVIFLVTGGIDLFSCLTTSKASVFLIILLIFQLGAGIGLFLLKRWGLTFSYIALVLIGLDMAKGIITKGQGGVVLKVIFLSIITLILLLLIRYLRKDDIRKSFS